MKLISALIVLLSSLVFSESYELLPTSEARFYINEVLLGRDKTVVGVTNDISTTIDFDLANPAAAGLSTIIINARDLTTDDNRRNNQLRSNILQSNRDEFQYITFEATSIVGLPDTVAVGDSFDLQITGLLTIRGTSLEKSFDVTVTVLSDTELQGLARTVVTYKEFDLRIPSVPLVASVEDEVILELDFVASR